MVTMQGCLFGAGDEIGPGPFPSPTERTHLGEGAWVDFFPHWLRGADALFDELLHAVPWQADRRPMYDRVVDVPRLLAFYGSSDPLPSPSLEVVKYSLVDNYRGQPGGRFSTVGLCLYRDGRDSVAWHADKIGLGAMEETMVAIVSLGTPRRLLLRAKGGGARARYDLGGGDLLVMGGTCQNAWEHSIPKSTRTGTRISVQYRPRLTSG